MISRVITNSVSPAAIRALMPSSLDSENFNAISAAMESLNAGVAAGIALYEVARQRAASAAQA